MPLGPDNVAALAGPPLPVKPFLPVPASWWMVPRLRSVDRRRCLRGGQATFGVPQNQSPVGRSAQRPDLSPIRRGIAFARAGKVVMRPSSIHLECDDCRCHKCTGVRRVHTECCAAGSSWLSWPDRHRRRSRVCRYRQWCDAARLGIHLAYEMILHFYKYHIACGIETNFVWFI